MNAVSNHWCLYKQTIALCIFPDDLLLQEDLLQIWPMIGEANAMSEEMEKKCKFEIALISPQARGLKHGRTEVGSPYGLRENQTQTQDFSFNIN